MQKAVLQCLSQATNKTNWAIFGIQSFDQASNRGLIELDSTYGRLRRSTLGPRHSCVSAVEKDSKRGCQNCQGNLTCWRLTGRFVVSQGSSITLEAIIMEKKNKNTSWGEMEDTTSTQIGQVWRDSVPLIDHGTYFRLYSGHSRYH